MKNQIMSLIALSMLTFGSISCKEDKKVETTEAKAVTEVVTKAVASETFKVIPAETMITWDAQKIIGGHQGTINASSGVLDIIDNKVVGGNFIIDINTIDCTDLEDEGTKSKLLGHLKGEDFFDIKNNPNGAFEITGVTLKDGKSLIAGNLTLKGIKKNIEFPGTISVDNGTATIKSESFNIDRTEWGINYNSGKLTDAAALGDKLIKDEIGITVTVIAKK